MPKTHNLSSTHPMRRSPVSPVMQDSLSSWTADRHRQFARGVRCALAAIFVLCCASGIAIADEDETADEIFARITKLAAQESSESQIQEMDELLILWEKAVVRERLDQKKEAAKGSEAMKGSAAKEKKSNSKTSAKPTRKAATKKAATKNGAKARTGKKKSTSKKATRKKPTSRSKGMTGGKPDSGKETKKETKKKKTGRRKGKTSSRNSKGKKSKKGRSNSKTPLKGVDLRPELNVDAENFLKPYDQRTYTFSIDGTYVELIESFSRMSGLSVLGQAPAGDVKFTSSEVMDFKSALGRVRMLLFRHPQDMYWIDFKQSSAGKYLELYSLREGPRPLPLERIYPTVEEYRADDLEDNEMAMLVYTPESGSVAKLEPLRDFMPDYVRIAQVPDKNQMNIFGLVRDINKYLELIKKFEDDTEDPREIRVLAIEHVLPSEALESLKKLVDGFGAAKGASARKRKKGQASVATAQARGIIAIPNDEMKTLLLYAMRKKIEEVEKFLQYVDVPLPDNVRFDPVVVEVKHAKAGEVLTLVQSMMTTDVVAKPRPKKKIKSKRGAKKPRRKTRASAGSRASLEELTMIEFPPRNSIILLGTEEKVAEARALIARFDMSDDTTREFVRLEHRDPTELVALVNELLSAAGSDRVTCTVDSEGDSVIIIGAQGAVQEAKDLIAKLDVVSDKEAEDPHSIKLVNARPSTLISILTQWDSGSPAPRKPVGKGKKKGAARRRRSGTTRFQADDASNTLYVICTDSDWDEKYRPMIVKLDRDLKAELEYDMLAIHNIEPQAAIATLKSIFDSPNKGMASPTYLESAGGLMVFDATEWQLASMKNILLRIDVDVFETGAQVRRTFTLEYVDASELVPLLEAMISTPSVIPTPKRGGKKKGAAATQTSSVRFIERGNKLHVMASPRKMERIAELVKEFDSNEDETAIRSYDFEPGTNVAELARTLAQFFPRNSRIVSSSRKSAGKNRKRSKGTKPVTAVASRGAAQILFVPQPETRKIFISAPVTMFDEIEEAIELVRPNVDGPGFDVEFIDLAECDPVVIVEIVEPMIELQRLSYIRSGELPEASEKESNMTLTADPGAKRIIYAGPKILIEDLKKLISQIEAGRCGEDVVRRVPLFKAPADQMAIAINAMITGKAGPGAIRTKGKARSGKKGAKKRSAPTMKTTGIVTVVAAPGGDALVVKGPAEEVDKVETWIRLLDEEANTGRQMKVYKLTSKDVEEFADEIMMVIDAGAAPKGGGKTSDLDDFSFGGPRRGGNISLTTNYFSNEMIVWASPQDLARIDSLFEIYESGAVETREELPSALVELKYADPFDASFALEEFIDALWTKDKPKVDYVPYSKMLVVKSRNLDEDLPRIEELIAKNIDLPDKRNKTKTVVTGIKDKPVDLVAAMLLQRLAGFDVEIEGLEASERGPRIKVLTPDSGADRCVVPSSMFLGLEAVLLSLGEPPAEDEQQVAQESERDAEPAPADDAAEGAKEKGDADPNAEVAKMLQDLVDAKVGQNKAAQADADDTGDDSPQQKVRIVVDRVTNSISLIGRSDAVSDAEYEMKKIIEELEKLPQLPDVRVWQLQHVDPNVAAQVLESMFNAGGRARAQARVNPRQQGNNLQKQLLQMQQKMQNQMKAMQKNSEAGGDSDGKGDKRKGKEDDKAKGSAAKQTYNIKVFPYPALNAIIVKAPTEIYPALEELIATIDRKGDSESDYRFFKINNQLASDVEMQLKQIFGLDQKQSRQRPQPRGRKQGANAAAVAAAMQQQGALQGLMGGNGGMISSTETITIASNDVTNTIMIRAPKRVLEVAEEIIDKIEEQAPEPIETREFRLAHGDAETVVGVLDKLFAASGGGRAGKQGGLSSFHPDNIEAIFIADTANNTVFARAKTSAFDTIAEAIEKLDVPQDDGDLVTVDVLNGDADTIASTLEAIYGLKGGGRKGKSGGAGSRIEFIADSGSSKIFVRAPESMRSEIKARIAEIDVPQTGLDIKVFKLKYAKAPRVLEQMNTMVTKLVQQIRASGKSVKLDPFSAEADVRSNSLVVMGGPITFALVARVLAEIDVEAAAPMRIETKLVALSKSDAVEIAAMINRLYGGKQEDGLEPPKAEANASTNTLIVRGTAGQLAKIDAEVIKKIDEIAGGAAAPVQEIYNMTEARASNVAELINKMLGGRSRGGKNPIKVVADDEQNVLVIASSRKDYEELLPLIKALDKKPETQTGIEVRVYPLVYVEPESLVRTVRETFKAPRGAKPQDEVKVNYISGTSSLVVSATTENHDKVADLLTRVDTESSVKRTTHVIALKEANAEEMAERLSQILQRTRRKRRDDAGLNIVADPGTNSLLVFANEAELDAVNELIVALDVPQKYERQVKSFRLEFADVWSTSEALKQLFGQRRGGRKMNPRDQVSVVPAWGSNSVIIAASPERIAEIESFLEGYDKESSGEREVRVVEIKYADSSDVASALQEIFVRGRRNTRGQETISVTAAAGTDAILIKANEKEFEELSKVIEQLDVLPDDTDRAVRTFTLKFTNADEMQSIIEDYLRKPGSRSSRGGRGRRGSRGGGGGGELLGRIRVSTLESSNMLVVTGDQDGLKRVAGLIEQIDVEMEAESGPKIIKLERAIASEVQPTLAELFVENAGRRGGRGRGRSGRGGSGSSMTPVIVANDVTNSLIVRANPGDYAQIERLALALDSEESGGDRVKLIQLSSAYRAEDLAATLEATLAAAIRPRGGSGSQRGRRGGRGGRGGRSGSTLSVEPIRSSNSLLIAGDAKQLELAEVILAQIQEQGPAGGRRTLILTPDKMSPEDFKRVIEEMMNKNKSQGSRRQPRRGRRR